jgi:hypothetical protein
MHEPDTIAPDLKSLLRQTGVVRATGLGCALTLCAFSAPIAVAAWRWGWSWWLLAGVLAGLLIAAPVALLAARRIAIRTLSRLAGDGEDVAPDAEGDDSLPPDPHRIAEAIWRALLLGEKDPGALFADLRGVDPAVCAEAATVLQERTVDDLVNGEGPDEARLDRFTTVVHAVRDGARRLRGTPAAPPWEEAAAALGRSLCELHQAMREGDDPPIS